MKRTAKKCTKIYNVRAQLLLCSLNLLFGAKLHINNCFDRPSNLALSLFFVGLDSDAKQNYRPSFMDHFDRIFEAGERGSESGANGSSEEDSGGLLRGIKPEDPFKLKKAGPP